MSSAFGVVLTLGVFLLSTATPQIPAQAAGKAAFQQPWSQHPVGPESRWHAPAHQPATPRQHQYPAATRPYSAPAKPYSAPAKPFSGPAKPYSTPVKPYSTPAKPYRASAKPHPTAIKSHAVPAKQYTTAAAKPKPALARPYPALSKPQGPQRPLQRPPLKTAIHKPSYPSPPKPHRQNNPFRGSAGVAQFQYPGGQVQNYAPAKRVHGSKQKQAQVIKKRLTPAQLRQIQQWQIAVQFPPGTQVQPGTGGPPPGPAVPGHIWIQVPVPPQGSYPPPQVAGPPVDQPAPVEPVPEVPAEQEQPEDPSEAGQPEVPNESEQPQETYEPEQPQGPYEPEQPQETNEPEQSQGTVEPEQPQEPSEPEQPEGPYEPEQPQEPEQPDYPEEPAQTGETSESEQPQEELPVPGNQPIQPLPEEVSSTEETPEGGEEYVPESPDTDALAPGGEDGSEGTWTEEQWGGDGSQELTEPDPAMALLLESCQGPRGQFPSASACNKFVNCWDGFAVEQQCPGGLVFNEAGFCDYPDNVDCGSRESAKPGIGGEEECPTPYGHYRSVESCGLFYVCVAGKAVKFECPEGLNYNTELGICDYPSRVDCGGTPSDRPPPEEPVTEVPDVAEAEESPDQALLLLDPNNSDPARKKFFKLKKVPAKPAVRPWTAHHAPTRGAPWNAHNAPTRGAPWPVHRAPTRVAPSPVHRAPTRLTPY